MSILEESRNDEWGSYWASLAEAERDKERQMMNNYVAEREGE